MQVAASSQKHVMREMVHERGRWDRLCVGTTTDPEGCSSCDGRMAVHGMKDAIWPMQKMFLHGQHQEI